VTVMCLMNASAAAD
ncbi:DUF3789 domain-containing protein, partial [Staphylococcus aureus]|nr:DUF3789 domain-containing protein [Staphylococcus aureus]